MRRKASSEVNGVILDVVDTNGTKCNLVRTGCELNATRILSVGGRKWRASYTGNAAKWFRRLPACEKFANFPPIKHITGELTLRKILHFTSERTIGDNISENAAKRIMIALSPIAMLYVAHREKFKCVFSST